MSSEKIETNPIRWSHELLDFCQGKKVAGDENVIINGTAMISCTLRFDDGSLLHLGSRVDKDRNFLAMYGTGKTNK